jgi:hypothetical protein
MTEFEQKLCDALNNIAKATEHVSSSLDEISSTIDAKDTVDMSALVQAITELGGTILRKNFS